VSTTAREPGLESGLPPRVLRVPRASRYGNPYLAGVGIGLVLLAAYVLAGRGLGASGAFSSVATAGAAALGGTARTAANPAFAPYLADGAARADALVGRTPAESTSAVTWAARPRAFHGA